MFDQGTVDSACVDHLLYKEQRKWSYIALQSSKN